MTPAEIAAIERAIAIFALIGDLEAVAATPADDPRRAEFAARKAALLAEVES